MFVQQWMVKNPVTVNVHDSLDQAYYAMKENNVSRLPVLDDIGKVVGILTQGDCMRVSPSPASTLSKQEANYLLSKLTISEVMTKKPITVHPQALVEEVALTLRQHKIEGLPVVEDERLVGIISKSDIFDALMDIVGVGSESTRVILECENRCGILADVSQCFQNHGVLIENVAKIHRNEHNKVYLLVRFKANKEDQDILLTELSQHGYALDSVVC